MQARESPWSFLNQNVWYLGSCGASCTAVSDGLLRYCAGIYEPSRLLQDPKVDYLMTLYLCPDVDPQDLANNAKASHVVGVGHNFVFLDATTAHFAVTDPTAPTSCAELFSVL